MKISAVSHLDHGLTDAHVAWIATIFADRSSFFIETIELPDDLSPLRCALHGPLVGESPIQESEVRYVRRGDRAGESRVCDRPFLETRLVSVIAGPHGDDPCVLFTAFGGPAAPREPWDPSLDASERERSEKFWARHALSVE
jgi:hypothetical protein